MPSYTKCDTLQDFFKVKNEMESRGIIYVPSQTNPPKSGTNYVKQHGYFFSTCSEYEFNKYNESDEDI